MLRVRAAIVDIRVVAPDVMSSGRSRTYSREAGQATLVVEARDAVTNALLGRGIDRRDIGDNGSIRMSRNSVTNQADFANAFTAWARISVKILEDLKTAPPAAAK